MCILLEGRERDASSPDARPQKDRMERKGFPSQLTERDGGRGEERAAQTIVSRISSFIFFSAGLLPISRRATIRERERGGGALATNKKKRKERGEGAKMTVRRPRNDVEEIERRGRRKHLISHDIGDFL